MNKELAELNFNKLLYYENIRGYSKQKPFKCNGFCIDCELKGILKDGEKLERMSHGADSDDFRKVIPKQYNNNTPIMFLMLDPAPSFSDNRDEHLSFENISKDIPTKMYYWVTDYISEPVTYDVISKESTYDLYWWYLQEKHSLNNIYITNTIKCYSALYHSRKPNYNIQNNCIENFLVKEIELFNPQIIFCLHSKVYYIMKHNPLIKKLLERNNTKVAKLKHPSMVETYHKNQVEYLNNNDEIIDKTINSI